MKFCSSNDSFSDDCNAVQNSKCTMRKQTRPLLKTRKSTFGDLLFVQAAGEEFVDGDLFVFEQVFHHQMIFDVAVAGVVGGLGAPAANAFVECDGRIAGDVFAITFDLPCRHERCRNCAVSFADEKMSRLVGYDAAERARIIFGAVHDDEIGGHIRFVYEYVIDKGNAVGERV